LGQHTQWWEGPWWLRHEENDWQQTLEVFPPEDDEPPGPTAMALPAMVRVRSPELTVKFERFSNYGRLVRAVAYAKRFLSSEKKKGPITGKEWKQAEVALLRLHQKEEPYDPRQLKD